MLCRNNLVKMGVLVRILPRYFTELTNRRRLISPLLRYMVCTYYENLLKLVSFSALCYRSIFEENDVNKHLNIA